MSTHRKRIYQASPKHCEPITAQRPGVKCPTWSISLAQKLLDSAQPVGTKLQATYDGVGFVAQMTRRTDEEEFWHGYPEAWDNMDMELKKQWLKDGLISGKNLRTYRTRRRVREAFGGSLVER